MYADPTLMDLAAAYAKRRNGRKTKHAVACDRPGAKAKFVKWFTDRTKELLREAPYVVGETKKIAKQIAAQSAQLEAKLNELKAIKDPSAMEVRDRIIALHNSMTADISQLQRALPNQFSRQGNKSNHAVDYPAMLRALDNTMLEAKANGLEFLQSYKIARQVANSRVLRGRQATAGEILDARKRLEEDMAEEMGQSKHSRPGAKAKSTRAALPPQTLEAERKPGGGSHSEAVSRKIATLINEGKPQDQAVAIALDLERRGEL